jgi:hypothetical protein
MMVSVGCVRPRCVGRLPNGPAAAVAADLAERRGWPPRRVTLEPIKSERTAICMGLSDIVLAGEIVHPKDAMLSQHIGSTTRLWRSDSWVYARRGASPIDANYAVAASVHLARTMGPPRPPLVAL